MMGKGVKLAQCYLDGSSIASMAVPPILLVCQLVGKDAIHLSIVNGPAETFWHCWIGMEGLRFFCAL